MTTTLDDRMAFVICAPRSGSTMLVRVLGAHSQIYTRPESHLLLPLHQLGYFQSVEHPGSVGGLLAYEPRMVEIAIRGIVEELPRGEADYLDAVRQYLDTIHGRLLENSGKGLFVEKTPRYALVRDFLRLLYPRARFVVLTRNPIAVAFSMAKFVRRLRINEQLGNPTIVPGQRHQAPEEIALEQIEAFGPAVAGFLRDPSLATHHVRYEDFVTDPAVACAEVCRYLGVPFEPRMLEYDGTGPWKGLGDPFTTTREQRPVTHYASQWKDELGSEGRNLGLARATLARISAADVETWGYSWSELHQEIERRA